MRRENTAGVVLYYGECAFYVGMRRKKTPLNGVLAEAQGFEPWMQVLAHILP